MILQLHTRWEVKQNKTGVEGERGGEKEARQEQAWPWQW